MLPANGGSYGRLPIQVRKRTIALAVARRRKNSQWLLIHTARRPTMEVAAMACLLVGVISTLDPILMTTLMKSVPKRKGNGYFQSQRQICTHQGTRLLFVEDVFSR